ncbi:histidine phosphatase family protein [Rhodococcus oryzae]|uniref:Histidine phosphatase family protein n=1 Tax=Rhodococcus oryzae TaxID=2571143 RepID=A0ABY2RMV8_9NOCA|nr:histidine phosphatase family protein [Rhodococcus oryzae]TJZ79634.1 histidine phosphatase family protein [Rhodococcus oryzae]
MRSKVLILLRHGKSAYPDGVADHARPLAPRGQREAGLAGDWIRLTQPPVDAVLCSTATRTRLTLAASGIDAPARYADTLYGASAAEVLREIASTDAAVRTLLVVGHEPGIPDTALALDPGGPLAERIADRFPTSAMATLAVTGSWADLLDSRARLTDFHIPR